MTKITVLLDGKPIHTIDLLRLLLKGRIENTYDAILDKQYVCTVTVNRSCRPEPNYVVLQEGTEHFMAFSVGERLTFQTEEQ